MYKKAFRQIHLHSSPDSGYNRGQPRNPLPPVYLISSPAKRTVYLYFSLPPARLAALLACTSPSFFFSPARQTRSDQGSHLLFSHLAYTRFLRAPFSSLLVRVCIVVGQTTRAGGGRARFFFPTYTYQVPFFFFIPARFGGVYKWMG